MLSKTWKLACLSGLSLCLFLANGAAFAQSDEVVVPTVPSGSSTPSTTPSPTTTTNTTNTTTATTTTPNSFGSTRFFCQEYNGQYTVMYQPESRPGEFFAWAAPGMLGGGWNPQLRCQTIAQRLESYRPDGLQELQITRLNNENIICVTTEVNSSCRIVLTVPRNRDPYTVRNNIFQNLMTADSGQQTTAVNTYTNNGKDELSGLTRSIFGGGNRATSSRNGIDLKPFLDAKDGGTGTQLRNGVAINRQAPSQVRTRLNPQKFR